MSQPIHTTRHEIEFIDRLGLNEYSKTPRIILLKNYLSALVMRNEMIGMDKNKLLKYVNVSIQKEIETKNFI